MRVTGPGTTVGIHSRRVGILLSRPDLLHNCLVFFFNDTATTEIYTLSLHDALPIWSWPSPPWRRRPRCSRRSWARRRRSEEHTSELQSLAYLVCRLLLEKKKHNIPLAGPRTSPTHRVVATPAPAR